VVLRRPRALSVTSVVENGATLAGSGYRMRHHGGTVERISGSYPATFDIGIDAVVVTYVSGVTGDDLTLAIHAVKQMLKHLWTTQRGAKRAQTGDEWEAGSGYSFPRRVMELLDPLTNSVGFA